MPEALSASGTVRGDFASVRFRFGTYNFSQRLKELSHKHSVTPGEITGVHPIPVDTTLGVYKAEGSFTLQETDWLDFIATVGDGYTRIVRDITVTLEKNPRAPGGYNTIVLHNCRIIGEDSSYKREDKDGRLVKVDLYVRYITKNGFCLVPLVLEDGFGS